VSDAWEEHGGPEGPPPPDSPPSAGGPRPVGPGQPPGPDQPQYIDPGAPWPPTSGAYRWSPPPGSGPGAPRRSPDPRTLLWVAIGVVVLAVLVRDHRITSFELLMLGALVPSVILHEISHGAVALVFGDDTAKRAGRLTLNPIPHIDPFGTLILPALLALSGLGVIGYAKPVPVNVSRLRRPRNQAVLVSLVGPAVNIALALLCALAIKHLVAAPVRQEAGLGSSAGVALSVLPGWAQYVFVAGFVNVILAAFNLIPLPPLDGSAVLERLLPRPALPAYYRLRPFTIVIPLAVVLLFPGALDHIFSPALTWFGHLVA